MWRFTSRRHYTRNSSETRRPRTPRWTTWCYRSVRSCDTSHDLGLFRTTLTFRPPISLAERRCPHTRTTHDAAFRFVVRRPWHRPRPRTHGVGQATHTVRYRRDLRRLPDVLDASVAGRVGRKKTISGRLFTLLEQGPECSECVLMYVRGDATFLGR